MSHHATVLALAALSVMATCTPPVLWAAPLQGFHLGPQTHRTHPLRGQGRSAPEWSTADKQRGREVS